MKKVLGVAVVSSLIANAYLGFLLLKEGDKTEAAAHAEMISRFGFEDLSHLLRHSGMTKAQLLELVRKQPIPAGSERAPPSVAANRFYRFPLEVTFAASGTIDQIKVAGDRY
jgi:hypothetical protein